MTNTEKIGNDVILAVLKELLIADVNRFVNRMGEIENDPDLDGPDRRALMAGAASGFRELFLTNLTAIKNKEVAK